MNKLPARLALSGVVLCNAAWAGTIYIDSQPGLQTNKENLTRAISPHSLWQGNNPDNSAAVWVSYDLTGWQDSVFAALGSGMSVYHSFTSFAGTLDLKVWADDTAEVMFDGISVFAPNFSQNVCADGPIGCEPNEFGNIHLDFASGTHTLQFNVYQGGTGDSTSLNPFGLLYTGTATYMAPTSVPGTATPEPGTWLLILGGLAMIVGGKFAGRARAEKGNEAGEKYVAETMMPHLFKGFPLAFRRS